MFRRYGYLIGEGVREVLGRYGYVVSYIPYNGLCFTLNVDDCATFGIHVRHASRSISLRNIDNFVMPFGGDHFGVHAASLR
jgi:hypothetical protein